jgi:hypothetical protein
MRIRRAVIIPAILALGVGSVVAGSAMPSAAGHAPSTSVQAVASIPAVHHRA